MPGGLHCLAGYSSDLLPDLAVPNHLQLPPTTSKCPQPPPTASTTAALMPMPQPSTCSPAAYASALRLMSALCEGSATAQMAVTGTGLLTRLAAFPEGVGYAGPVAEGGRGWGEGTGTGFFRCMTAFPDDVGCAGPVAGHAGHCVATPHYGLGNHCSR